MDYYNYKDQDDRTLRMYDPHRADFPTTVHAASPYRVVNGRIHSEACELSITEHCNFTCRGCSHLSPITSKHILSPQDIARDLNILAQHYHVDHVRLVGGEPLLHPQITDIISAIRSSGITKRIRVITNGSLPHLMTSEIWEAVDEIHVSVYPGKEPPDTILKLFKELASKYDTDLVIKHFDKFRESYSEIGTDNAELIRRIYQTCQIAHIWRCHTIRNGFFYRCPQSVFIPRVLSRSELTQQQDALAITDSPDFGERLLAFLEQPEPLRSCHYCLGSVGNIFEHSQVTRSDWRQLQHSSTEEMIDYIFLAQLEHHDPDYDNGCWTTEL